VQLNADAEAGDTTLTTKPLPEAIVAGSTVEYPLKLRARTTADLDRSGNRVTTVHLMMMPTNPGAPRRFRSD
jgi:hypothetical protein